MYIFFHDTCLTEFLSYFSHLVFFIPNVIKQTFIFPWLMYVQYTQYRTYVRALMFIFCMRLSTSYTRIYLCIYTRINIVQFVISRSYSSEYSVRWLLSLRAMTSKLLLFAAFVCCKLKKNLLIRFTSSVFSNFNSIGSYWSKDLLSMWWQKPIEMVEILGRKNH